MANNTTKKHTNTSTSNKVAIPRWLAIVVATGVALAGIYLVYSSLASSSSVPYLSTVFCRDGECFALERNGTVEKQAYIRDTSTVKCSSGFEYLLVENINTDYICLTK